MCYAPSARELAEIAVNNEDYVGLILRNHPEAYRLYLEAKRVKAFREDAVAALEAGWPSDEDLAGLVESERATLLVAANLRMS